MIKCSILYSNLVEQSMRKLLICTTLGTFSAFHYMFYIFLGGYNSRTTLDIVFKFLALLSCVEATKCVKFQSPRCSGIKVGIFRISPIVKYKCYVIYFYLLQ